MPNACSAVGCTAEERCYITIVLPLYFGRVRIQIFAKRSVLPSSNPNPHNIEKYSYSNGCTTNLGQRLRDMEWRSDCHLHLTGFQCILSRCAMWIFCGNGGDDSGRIIRRGNFAGGRGGKPLQNKEITSKFGMLSLVQRVRCIEDRKKNPSCSVL